MQPSGSALRLRRLMPVVGPAAYGRVGPWRRQRTWGESRSPGARAGKGRFSRPLAVKFALCVPLRPQIPTDRPLSNAPQPLGRVPRVRQRPARARADPIPAVSPASRWFVLRSHTRRGGPA